MARTRTPKKRTYAEGSVYQRCDERRGCPPTTGAGRPAHRCSGPWVGAFVHGFTERGTRRRYTVKGDTEAQARTRMRKRMGEVLDGGGAAASSKTTVKQWAEEWLDIVERELRPQPFTSARSAVRRWIVPTIGHKRLSDLAPADVRKVANAQRSAGLKPSSQRRTHSVLITMLKAARADGYAVPSIVVEVKAPAAGPSDRSDLPLDLAVEILGVAAEIPQGSRWVAALLQGLRQAEALGLTWDEVDLERGLLTISWQLQPLPYRFPRDRSSGFRVPDGYEARQVKGRWHLVRPKTRAGWRVIPLVPWMVTSLKAWREIAPESEHGLVWPTLDGGPCDPKLDDVEWYALQETVAAQRGADVQHPAGRPFTIHEARHTTATLLLEAGVDPAVIIAILGHSSMLSTKGYLHVKTAPLAAAMAAVAERLQLAA
ncbi:tyrosine-type recombinase/integrase [Pimelobacter simplex]|uniref:tyrosine-type recombinase/integrase n=1 Tax=Nocardioides simplex TaxID=2045 RepID=UPI000535F6AC|nr:tyrosine-type recombinase/integrase [Pimelobacter simplex]MCG8150357.1 tyrosine-type recombinase/integrase [Pimelobacter simplex]GEB16724.1 putative phage integrase [Pimelobacter simplex]SFM89457.1 Site-specific recombinase XerD [Pimelobacter simplex]